MKKRTLIQRYDNEPDILAVEKNGCSDTYDRVQDDDFSLVVIVPTVKANSQIVVISRADGPQYTPDSHKDWPGRPGKYPYRINVKDVRKTTLAKIKEAFKSTGEKWAGHWTVKSVMLEEDDLT